MSGEVFDYAKAVKYIEEIPKFTKKHSLAHTAAFLKALSVDEERFKIIHVAGTNGKGSVCAMLAELLAGAGKQVGLFTSPHLICIRERIQINRESVSEEGFLEAFLKVKEVVNEMAEKEYTHPSYFEFLFLMAMTVFDREAPEYLILETGLGGRLDATNCITSPLVTILTQIGFDHMEYLGTSIEEIAGEKAGIIKQGVPIIYWAEEEAVRQTVGQRAQQMKAEQWPVTVADYKILAKTDKGIDFLVKNGYYSNDSFTVPFISEYQVKNAMLTLTAFPMLLEARECQWKTVKESLLRVRWAGRMEAVASGIIFDGAHNGPGIDEFIKTFREYKCDGTKSILFSVVKDKDYEYMIQQLAKTDVARVYITQLSGDRALEAEKLRQDFVKVGCHARLEEIADIREAYHKAVADRQEGDVLFCVGSLYLIGELERIASQESCASK